MILGASPLASEPLGGLPAAAAAAGASFVIPNPRWEEPNLLIPGRKPVGPVQIDWSHPLARDIEACWVTPWGKQLRDLKGKYITTTGTNPATIQRGNLFYVPSGTTGTEYDLRPSAAGDRTLYIRGRSNLTTTQICLSIRLGSGSFNQVSLGYNYWTTGAVNTTITGGFSAFATRDPDPHSYSYTAAGIVAAGEWFTLVGVFKSGEALKIYVNGKKLSVTSSLTFDVGDGWSAAQHTEIGGAADGGSTGWNGDIATAGIFTRALSDAEATSLSANPYQFLIPA